MHDYFFETFIYLLLVGKIASEGRHCRLVGCRDRLKLIQSRIIEQHVAGYHSVTICVATVEGP